MKSPWMTTEDVAAEFRFTDADGNPSPRLAWEYLQREKVQAFKRGRINLYRRDDVVATLRVTNVAPARRSA